jgi:hypothetical protein
MTNQDECIFWIKPGLMCGRKCTFKKCIEHKDLKCRCGAKADHYCSRGGCKEPLCKNRYCTTIHNIKEHKDTVY